MKLSVVVPCYNEAANVSEFESELSKALLKEKITYEIIFIDDGSTDDTYSKLSSLNKANKNVKVTQFINHRINVLRHWQMGGGSILILND